MDPADETKSSVAPLCPLQYAASRIEECPGPRCPFWVEPSGKKGGCAVTLAGIDLERSPETVARSLKAPSGARPRRVRQGSLALLPAGVPVASEAGPLEMFQTVDVPPKSLES